MEQISDALLMAFAVLVLVIGLSVTMSMFSRARQASDYVLSVADTSGEITYDETVDVSRYRIVGLETIIPTLYRYEKENLTVVFLKANYDAVNGNIWDVQALPIYTTITDSRFWAKSYAGYTRDPLTDPVEFKPSYGYNLNGGPADPQEICVFDVGEENARGEPFIVNRKKNVDDLIYGVDTSTGGNPSYTYVGTPVEYNYVGNPLTHSNYKYIEMISNEEKSNFKGNRTTGKTVITYIKIN